MQQFQIAVPLGSMPLQLVCISDASIAFVKTQDFKALIDNSCDKVSAMFDNEGFSIGKVDYQYNTKIFYKEIPSMLEWLQAQKLEMPHFS